MKMRKSKLIDWKLIGILALFYTIFDIVYLAKIVYLRSIADPNPKRASLVEIIYYNFLFDWIVVVLFMSVIAISTKLFITKRIKWRTIIIVHMIFAILMGFVVRFGHDAISIIRGDLTLEKWDFFFSLTAVIRVLELNFLIYFAMSGIIYTFYYLEQMRHSNEQKALVEEQLTETKLRLLNSKLQPHFLFNTLNTISCLIDLNHQKAQDSIVDLSLFLRNILYTDEPKIKLREELLILKNYTQILEARFGDHLKFQKKINPATLKYKVPSMTLQPIIENAVKHGYSPSHKSVTISIETKISDDQLLIDVFNNGQPLDETNEPFNQGIGLQNITQRLSTLYGKDFSFEITNLSDKEGVAVRISIPAEL